MERLDREDWARVMEQTVRVFSVNEVDKDGFYYHMPNANHYPSLFAWDSAFNAVTMIRIDPDKAARELETLFSQVAADGRMPHEVLLNNRLTNAGMLRNIMRWALRWDYDSNTASHLVDPPVYVTAAEMVFEKTGDLEWLGRIWKKISVCLDYLIDDRDLFGDGLVTIFHPWEAGTDLSPQFHEALGIDPATMRGRVRSVFHVLRLHRFCSSLAWDPQALAKANRFVFEDLTMNCIMIRALGSASRLAAAIGDRMGASRYASRQAKMGDALERICWDEREGCYFPRWDMEEPRLQRIKTAACLLPLFAGTSPPERIERVVSEHLTNPDRFWRRYLLPFNPADELARSAAWVNKRLWAGSCIWMNFNWMLTVGLLEYGYAEEARQITLSTVRMIEREGFWEYYDSETGKGQRLSGFTWPGLALDLMARQGI